MASQLTDLERELIKALAALINIPDYDGERKTSQTRLRIKNKAKRLIKENPLCPKPTGDAAPAAAKTV